MCELRRLYENLKMQGLKQFYALESEFSLLFYNKFPTEPRPECVTVYFTISNWFGNLVRGGVWTFYESYPFSEIQTTIEFLKQTGEAELAEMLALGAHDYQNPKYVGNFEYPKEWITESEKIDEWIFAHEEWLYEWEYSFLLKNKEMLLELLG